MSAKLSRRKAMTAGASMTGLALGATTASHAWSLPDVGGSDYLTQWSPPAKVKRNLTPGQSSIRLSCVAKGLSNTKRNPAEQVKEIRDAGFTAAEAFHNGWRKMSDSETRELKAALKEHDLLFYNMHIWNNIINPDPERRRACHAEYLRIIDCAEQAGIGFVLVHTGSRGRGMPSDPHPENWTEETWRMSVNALKQVIADSPGSKVKLAVEAINSNNFNNPPAHVRLREDVGSDRLAFTLDPTNMMHAGVVFRSTELINTCFELMGENIMYAHGKDVRWTGMLPGLQWAIPGEGVMDYEVYLTHLSRLKHTRVLMLEFLRGDDQYNQAKQNIEQIAAKVGVKIYR
ncbi:sugar phosphate isomerase/epimerase family protein [Candidatus Latescibacterota bacterium]